jgi:hypothetical protein
MAGGVGIGFHLDDDGFKKAMDEMIVKAQEVGEAFVTQGGLLVEAKIKERSPVKSGTNRRSVGVHGVSSLGAGTWSSMVGPTTVYGRRLDLGFHGDDSLGRHYEQAGTHYVEGGLDASQGELGSLFDALATAALGV